MDGVPESKSVESIIDSLPITSFHHVLLIICSLSFMTDAIEVNLLSYISPCAGADFNLSEQQQATVVSVVFAGQLIGSLFWGPFADHFGRRIAFFYAALIITLFSFASAFATNYLMLLLFRCIVGFGVGGGAVPFDILAEFIPTQFRGKYLMYIQYFWTFGSLLIIGIAWGLLSTQGWRVVTFLAAIPVGICCLLCYALLPESPRWLVVKGRYNEAEDVLKLAARKCGVTLRPFRLQSEDTDDTPRQEPSKFDWTKLCNYSEYYELIRSRKARNISFPLWIIWFIFGFTYYGIILFVNQIYSTSRSSSDSGGCSFDFQFIFYSSLSEIIATAVTVPCIDGLGRIRTQIVFYLVSGIAVILMAMPFSFYTVFVIGLVGRIAISGASSATWVVTPELYPTDIRVSGNSMCVSWSRIGALLVPYLVISNTPIAVIGVILGALNIVAAGISFLLPETAGQLLGESRPLLGADHDPASDRLSKSSRASSHLIAGVFFSSSSKDNSEGSDGLLDSARDPLLA